MAADGSVATTSWPSATRALRQLAGAGPELEDASGAGADEPLDPFGGIARPVGGIGLGDGAEACGAECLLVGVHVC